MEMCDDLGGFFRVPLDNRGFNYTSYESSGPSRTINAGADYISQNTEQMTAKEFALLLENSNWMRHE